MLSNPLRIAEKDGFTRRNSRLARLVSSSGPIPRALKAGGFFLLICGPITLLYFSLAWSEAAAKQNAEVTPTSASSPMGAFITVTYIEPINVRTGPSSYDYPVIGTIPVGGTAPAIGRSPAGEWIQIEFPTGPRGIGWVYAANVRLTANALLPIVEPPPTAVPAVTPTVNPTFEAALRPAPTTTRLPTFTAPPPLQIPTFVNSGGKAASRTFQPGWVIAGLALVGLLGFAFSSLRRRWHWRNFFRDKMTLLSSRRKLWLRFLSILAILCLMTILALFSFPAKDASAQQPTGSIPTVTGTASGPIVTVYSDQNEIGVYSGPSFDSYPQIGILVSGQRVPALGYSRDEKWIQIVYMGVQGGKGWIYAPYVMISPGILPRLDSPPTATPATTPTLDPTYVAAFGLTLEPTQLATFTSPASLNLPTFAASTSGTSKLPYGLIIFSLIFIGVLGAIVSFLRGSR
jgi:uncharacterized protein YraI